MGLVGHTSRSSADTVSPASPIRRPSSHTMLDVYGNTHHTHDAQSMALDKQTAALKDALTAPLLKAKDLLVKDIREHDELLDEPE